MSRSVSTPSGVAFVAYQSPEIDETNPDGWDEYLEDVKESMKSQWPSLTDTSEWVGSEDHAFLENRFAQFGISEYCGLVALWVLPKEQETAGQDNLRDCWLASIEKEFARQFGDLVRVGRFSNGECVYERRAAK